MVVTIFKDNVNYKVNWNRSKLLEDSLKLLDIPFKVELRDLDNEDEVCAFNIDKRYDLRVIKNMFDLDQCGDTTLTWSE